MSFDFYMIIKQPLFRGDYFSKDSFGLIARLRKKYKSGSYQLLFYLHRDKKIAVGSLGELNFNKGYYIYTGTHKRTLIQRVERHLSVNKKLHWHSDYITLDPDFQIQGVILYPGNVSECSINQYFLKSCKASIMQFGFGNSDCQNNCGSHLLYLNLLQDKLSHWFNRNQIEEKRL